MGLLEGYCLVCLTIFSINQKEDHLLNFSSQISIIEQIYPNKDDKSVFIWPKICQIKSVSNCLAKQTVTDMNH